MNLEMKLQIAAGLGAVLALPIIYLGLTQPMTWLAQVGLGLFIISMLVTPVLRLRAGTNKT